MCFPAFQNIIDIKLFDTIFVLYYVKWFSGFVSEFTLLKLPHFFLNIPVRSFVSEMSKGLINIFFRRFLLCWHICFTCGDSPAVFLFLWKPTVSSVTLLVISTNLMQLIYVVCVLVEKWFKSTTDSSLKVDLGLRTS